MRSRALFAGPSIWTMIAGALALALSSGLANAATIDAAAGENPVMVSGKYELDPKKKSVKLPSHCSSYPSQKAIGVLEVKSDIPEVKIKSDAYMFAMVSESGQVTCANDPYKQGGAALLQRPLKAGKYQLFVGEQYNKPSATARVALVKFLNAKRGYVFSWEKEIKPRSVGKGLDEPIHFDGSVKTGGAWAKLDNAKNKCVGLMVPTKPDLVLDVTDDNGLITSMASSTDIHLVVRGPLPEGGGDIPNDCASVRETRTPMRKPGRYLVHVGSKQPIDATYSLLVLDKDKSKRTPTRITKDAGVGADVAHREAARVFPQLSVKPDLAYDDAAREALLQAAPTAMFVYANRNLTSAEAKAGLKSIGGGDTAARSDEFNKTKLPDFSYPVKDEPLLYLQGRYFLATDGGLFSISDLRHLSTSPSGAAVFPKAGRAMWASHEQSLELAAVFEAKAVETVKKDKERWHKCDHDIWIRPGKELKAINDQLAKLRKIFRPSRADKAKIAKLVKRNTAVDEGARKKVKKVCKTEAWHKRNAKARDGFIRARAKRHDGILAKVRGRFTEGG